MSRKHADKPGACPRWPTLRQPDRGGPAPARQSQGARRAGVPRSSNWRTVCVIVGPTCGRSNWRFHLVRNGAGRDCGERAEAEARAVATRPREPTTGELIGAAFKVAHEAFSIHQSLARQQAEDRTVTRERKPPAEPVADYFTTRRREWKEAEESSPVRELLRRRAAAKTALPPPPADNRPWWKRLWDAPPKKAVWR
jgi:hypothetical protein